MLRGRSISGNLIRAGRRSLCWLKTAQARTEAVLGASSRLLSTGEIDNIARDRRRIIVGSNTVIAGQLLTFGHGGQITIGNWCFVGASSRIWSAADITIGDRTLISHGVEIHDNESHPFDAEKRAEHSRHVLTTGHPKIVEGVRSAPIRIGNDVWIGFGAVIRKGSVIGDRAIIGAGCVVDGNIPADSLLKVAATALKVPVQSVRIA
jgi:acetyltransferase-like isoleucine patch superfamily enzyme